MTPGAAKAPQTKRGPGRRRPSTRRRLMGLDRSGPDPVQTRAGQPLRPFTLPNLIGYARLVGIPVFLYLALGSGDGRVASASILYAVIAAGDYVDGFVARATGQYSRMGAILDPVVDRLTILAGVVVCWHFELLPRWLLALVVAREAITLALAQIGLRRGIELEINWLGRIAVFFVMGGIFWAMVLDGWVPAALVIVGLVLSTLATVLYVRVGLARSTPATSGNHAPASRGP
jgi:phosphatidylglycerophosphate synthase